MTSTSRANCADFELCLGEHLPGHQAGQRRLRCIEFAQQQRELIFVERRAATDDRPQRLDPHFRWLLRALSDARELVVQLRHLEDRERSHRLATHIGIGVLQIAAERGGPALRDVHETAARQCLE